MAEKRLGALYGVSGRYRECRDAYQSAQAIDEQLYRLNASDQRTRLDLSYDYSDLGWVAARLGSYEQALESHRRALALRTEAAAADPNDFRAAVSVASSTDRIGTVLHKMGNLNGSLSELQRAVALYEALAQRPDADWSTVRSLAETRVDEAETLTALGGRGNLDRAMAAYERALRAYIRLRDQGVLPGAAASRIPEIQTAEAAVRRAAR